MPSVHKHPPIGYRPPRDIRPLLDARMKETGLGPSAILTQALREYFAGHGHDAAAPPRAAEPPDAADR